jgi:hypothetical protein
MSPYTRDMWRSAARCIIAFITGPMELVNGKAEHAASAAPKQHNIMLPLSSDR